jgi:hypothetical protein
MLASISVDTPYARLLLMAVVARHHSVGAGARGYLRKGRTRNAAHIATHARRNLGAIRHRIYIVSEDTLQRTQLE